MPKKTKKTENAITAELVAEEESEAVSKNFDEIDSADDDESKARLVQKGAGTLDVQPAEFAAINSDNDSAALASGDNAEPEMALDSKDEKVKLAKSKSVKPQARKSVRSAKYMQALGKLVPGKKYSIKEAIELVKETSYASFDGAVEVHLEITAKKAKAGESDRFRTVINLPNGTGKEPKIGLLDEEMIEKISKNGSVDFDILLSTPALMPKVAKIAKILGPKGKMPNPKTGTVTEDPEAAKRAILSGKIELRADSQNNIHQMIGRISWPTEKLVSNYQTIMSVIPTARCGKIVICGTMSPGVSVALS